MAKAKPGAKGAGGAPAAGGSGSGVPKGATAPADSFRSPVGCTGAQRGETEFAAWCAEEKVRFPSSRLDVLPDTGRALVASRNIKMGEAVVEVPDDAVLMADNCEIHTILEEYGMTKPADEEILEVQGLIIAVMYEKNLGSKSRWGPYLDLLPDDMTHMPLYWTRADFRELRGTAAYDKMLGRVQHPADAPTQVPMLWAEVIAPFIEEHPDLGLPGGERGYELYRWATCAVASYSFILGDDKYQAMVPVWDLLNHITGKVNVRLFHCPKRHVLQMIATRDIASGEELVNNYGELSNSELLRGYGFVEASNAHNHAQIPVSFVISAARDLLAEEAGGAGASRPAKRQRASASDGAAGNGAIEGAEEEGEEEDPVQRLVKERRRLAQRLGLFPQHHVFKVFAGRPPPAALTALIFTLLASPQQAADLAIQGRRASVAAARSVEASATGGRLKRSGKARRAARSEEEEEADDEAVAEAASKAAVEAASKVALAAAAAALGDGAAGRAAAVRMCRVYDALAERMLRRYGTSLQDDQALLPSYASLPPRRRAALLARLPEKEALAALRAALSGRPMAEQAAVLRASLASGPAAPGGKGAVASSKGAGAGAGEGKGGKGGEAEEKGKGKASGGKAGKGGKGKAGVADVAQAQGQDPFSFGFSL
ncbi:hypothetical protein HYH03_002797 [Edaphochlamys debaryana]|uniref:SET domain-containing protein n=1 Tax=Edaphochlamys debaryana TaxID=47281 RepID=A0A835YAA5_9CHLO|nr:hypothetical protein HYH03_002797 [Edaphochlamys debaryana]|eukprot:KAG2499217.1 hypothetical protein HYH03_002797 [Edaphochlamys debaryana]